MYAKRRLFKDRSGSTYTDAIPNYREATTPPWMNLSENYTSVDISLLQNVRECVGAVASAQLARYSCSDMSTNVYGRGFRTRLCTIKPPTKTSTAQTR